MSDFFYSQESDVTFSATSPEQYLREGFEEVLPERDVVVVQWRRRAVDREWLEGQAELLLEQFGEWFADEYGGEDDDCVKWSEADFASVEKDLAELLRAHADRNLRVFQCEEVSRRTYSPAEVRAIVAKQST